MSHTNEDIARYRISKAKDVLSEVDLHIENELWNTVVNRLYYACYYAVTALLAQNDIATKTHSGARQMFGLHFIKTGIVTERAGGFYTFIFELRQTGDYEDFVVLEKDEVIPLVPLAYKLVDEITLLLSKK